VLPSWLAEPLWGQFAALLPERPEYHPDHPLGCHRPRISDRIVFDKMLQVLRFGCSYQAIADTTCSATTIRSGRNVWIRLGVFGRSKQITLESYDRIVGLVLDQIAVDGSITKAPGGGEVAEHPRLAERLPPPGPLLRAPTNRHRRLLRPRRRRHHRT
jgi:transposase